MKPLFTPFLLFLVPCIAVAQPIIHSNGWGLGTEYVTQVSVGQASAGIGSPGPNQTWDFSTMAAVDGGLQWIVDADRSPYAASYPSRLLKYDF